MPNPMFEPIIGSSFDALAAQRAGWAGFNANIDTANIGRANAAQQNVNNYLMQLAQMRDAATKQNVNLQLGADQTAQEMAWRAAQERTRQAERGQDLALNQQMWQERLNAENARTKSAENIATARASALQTAQQAAVDQRGAAYAQQYAVVKKRQEEADAAFRDISEKASTAQANLDKILAKPKPSKEEAAQMIILRKQVMDAKTAAKTAEAIKRREDGNLSRAEAAILGHDFTIDDEAGSLTHVPTGKAFNFKRAMQLAPTQEYQPGQLNPLPTATGTTPAPYAGFQGVTAPAPTPAVAAPPTATGNTFKVGRFTVTPL